MTISGSGGRRDLLLPAEAPVRELLASLVEIAGNVNGEGPGDPGAWMLLTGGGETLPHDVTLEAAGVTDGQVLYLERVRPDRTPVIRAEPPAVEDGLTPAQRTARALPVELDTSERVRLALRALVGRDVPAASRPVRTSTTAAPRPSGEASPTPGDLRKETRPSPLERARRAWVESDYLERLLDAISAPRQRRCVTIAVISPKGGVGKTTITSLLGMLLAQLRRDRVVAIDTNPEYGTLGSTLVPDHRVYVDDLLDRLDQPNLTPIEVDALLGHAEHGLAVLPASTDPERAARLDKAAYDKVISRIKDFVGVVLLDCGTGLKAPAAKAAIEAADQLVLVTDEKPVAASIVAEAGADLAKDGRPLTIVVNNVPKSGSMFDLDLFISHLPDPRGIVEVSRQLRAAEHLAVGEFEWAKAPHEWQVEIARLAAVLLADWARLGLTQ